METSLHRDLKLHYAADQHQTEVSVEGFRIDAIAPCGELIEIQHASLAALRDKTRRLLEQTDLSLRIVKPIVQRKQLVTLTRKNGRVKRTRMSPKRGQLTDFFEDLVYFSTVFPRERLILEMVLVESREIRVDRKSSGWKKKKYRCLDQELLEVHDSLVLKDNSDLLDQLPIEHLPSPFDTAELAAAMQRPRWFAQKVAYCLRKTGAAKLAGKRGNSQLYRIPKKYLRAA